MLEEVIPIELGQLRQLEVLDISRNNIGGSIPAELGNCSKLSVLLEASVGSQATLEGQLPGSWDSYGNLELLNLANNYYSGKIPEGFSNCKKLHFLNLSSNRLTWEIFDKIHVPCITLFDISGNYLSGSIPKFNNDACAPFQSLRGDPSNFYDSTSAYISYFTHRTQIESPLPLFGDGDSFTVFHNFGSNNLTGTVQSMTIASERLGKQIVYAFFAGRNNLIGSFPRSFFEKCDQVRGSVERIRGGDYGTEGHDREANNGKVDRIGGVDEDDVVFVNVLVSGEAGGDGVDGSLDVGKVELTPSGGVNERDLTAVRSRRYEGCNIKGLV
ncbi:LRR receptor-like serine/threonine-protein kinase RPK2 [Forsythia ovata]